MKRRFRKYAAFTLIELVVVLLLIGVAMSFVAVRTGSYAYWKEEGFIRRLSETLIFLHHQALVDQAFYRIEFNLKDRYYRVGVIKPEEDFIANLENIAQDAGTLSLELGAFLSPAIGKSHTIIPSPSFPSLAEPVPFPAEIIIPEIRTMRGKIGMAEGEDPYILFSPRGFSEFAVIHLQTSTQREATILVNPFSGNTTVYHEYKDFEWTYGKNKKK